MYGQHFSDISDVQLNGSSVYFSVVSDNELTFVAPNGNTGGIIYATNTDGTGSSASEFHPEYEINATYDSGGNISPSGVQTITGGGDVTFSISPDGGYSIQDVIVDGSSVGAVSDYTFSAVDNDHSIYATFFQYTTYTISASTDGNGSINPSGSVTVNENDSPTFSISPNGGYAISDVIVDGSSAGAVSDYTFSNVQSDHSIYATFYQPVTYTITAGTDVNGSISPSGNVTVNENDSPTFSISSNSGYAISDVIVDGSSVGAVSDYTFSNVQSDHSIYATFYQVPTYTITATTDGNGSINPSGSVTVSENDSPTFTISANSNYGISDVIVDGSSVGPVSDYTFSNVQSDHSIYATFYYSPTFTITANTDGNGSISPSGSMTVNYNDSPTFTVSPNGGFVISNVVVDGNSVGPVDSYTFSNVQSDHTIDAYFDYQTYTFTTSGNWSTASNWDIGNAPPDPLLPGQTATIQALCTVDVDLTIAGGSTLTIPSGDITFANNNIVVGTGTVVLGPTTTVTGAGAGHCFVTSGVGTVQRAIDGNSNFQFPVAPTATTYNPLTIALASGDPTETFSVRVEEGINPTSGANDLSVQRTWNISESTPGGNHATLTFRWTSAEHGTNFTAGISPSAYRYNGSHWATPRLMTVPSLSSGAYTSSTIAEVTGFSPWIIASADALPIQLASFTAVEIPHRGVQLLWRTLSEINNYGFYVERRMSASSAWLTIENSFIPGHGTTNEPHTYRFLDSLVGRGAWSYRLKQVDLDGTIRFTEPVSITMVTAVQETAPVVFSLQQNYPNPFNPETTIKFSVESFTHATLTVFDIVGREVATLFDDIAEPGHFYHVLFAPKELSSGVYFYRLQTRRTEGGQGGKKNAIRKLLLMR